jgi:hypothetical protein
VDIRGVGDERIALAIEAVEILGSRAG